MNEAKDTLFQTRRGSSNFSFDGDVVKVFLDMIGRSIPCYWEVSRISAQLAATHLQPGTRIFDLGASLLTTTLEIAKLAPTAEVDFIAVDNSEAMVRAATERIASINDPRILVRHEDLLEVCLENSSVVVLNWTLQFLKPDDRQRLVNKIYTNLVPGGILIISEKLDTGGPGEFMHDAHIQHKLFNGYSREEVGNKLESLRGVMIPDSFETHEQRLIEAGFAYRHLWFRCLNWMSIAAIRQND